MSDDLQRHIRPMLPAPAGGPPRPVREFRSIFADQHSAPLQDFADLRVSKIYIGTEVNEFFDRVFAAPQTLEELAPVRTTVAWRLVRELARQRGAIEQAHDTLEAAGSRMGDPLHVPFRSFCDPKSARMRRLCAQHEVPLLPPDIPVSYLSDEGVVDESYTPMQDSPLGNYCLQLDHVATTLRVRRTADGRNGLLGLINPELVRIAMPTADRICEFEALIVREAFKLLQDGGAAEAEKWLREAFDLVQREITDVIAMARRRATDLSGLDDPRALLAMQLLAMDKNVAKLEEGAQHRAAFMARRDMARLALIQGRDDDNTDELDDDIKTVEHTVRDSQRVRLIPKKPGEES